MRLNLIYDEFTKYIREFNISDVEVLGIRQFARQLRREGYYADYNYRNFKERNNDEIVRQKCYILDLKKLNANLNLEEFAYEMTGITTDTDGFMAVDEQCELPFT